MSTGDSIFFLGSSVPLEPFDLSAFFTFHHFLTLSTFFIQIEQTKRASEELPSVMNQVGNSNFPPSVHLIFFSTNIRNENNTREIQKWPRARDRTSLISLRCVFFFF
jgi:1,4-dihydroxy-2-naphthoate octaprenyltransferase